jgi:hypothetical protein
VEIFKWKVQERPQYLFVFNVEEQFPLECVLGVVRENGRVQERV